MAKAVYLHPVKLDQEAEEAWLAYKADHPEQSFTGFVLALIKEALCVTNAPTSTIR